MEKDYTIMGQICAKMYFIENIQTYLHYYTYL